MQLRQLLAVDGDERAATPVIGIVLMIAVAVILAALISPQMLALSRESGEAGPQLVVDFDYDTSVSGAEPDSWGNTKGSTTGLLTITHAAGEGVPAGRLTVVGLADGDQAFTNADNTNALDDGEFDSGDELTVWVHEDDVIRIVWDSREGTKTTAVAVWDSD